MQSLQSYVKEAFVVRFIRLSLVLDLTVNASDFIRLQIY
jgi:hypothetical protein